jgi:hypothetical protein
LIFDSKETSSEHGTGFDHAESDALIRRQLLGDFTQFDRPRQQQSANSNLQSTGNFQPVLTEPNSDFRRDDRFVNNGASRPAHKGQQRNQFLTGSGNDLDYDELIEEPPGRRAAQTHGSNSGDDFVVDGPKMLFKVKVVPHIINNDGEETGLRETHVSPFRNNNKRPAGGKRNQSFSSFGSFNSPKKQNKNKKSNKNIRQNKNLFKDRPVFDDPEDFNVDDPAFAGISSGGEDEEQGGIKNNQHFSAGSGQGQNGASAGGVHSGQGGHNNFQVGHGLHQTSHGFQGNRRPTSLILEQFGNLQSPGLGNFRPSRLRPAIVSRPLSPSLHQVANDHRQQLKDVHRPKKPNNQQSSAGSGDGNSIGSFDDFNGALGSDPEFDNPNGVFSPGTVQSINSKCTSL